MLYTIKVTVLLNGAFWIGIFERSDGAGYAVARKIFGNEPTDAELYAFVLHHYATLKFSQPQQNIKLIVKRKNPKRVSREIRKEMEKLTKGMPMTRAQEALKLELEARKIVKKTLTRAQKDAAKNTKFMLKQLKKKQKQRGH